jgi:asparagine synthetase B (glutamine-hydrolysing)
MTFDELQFARLELKPGEAIVLRTDHALSQDVRRLIEDYVHSKLGASVPVLVLDGGMDISTVAVAEKPTLNPGAAWPFPSGKRTNT